ncbi:RidA family protein [Streptococcus iniae]|uniref:Endoribonuclease L-PSP n=1 Tax=Streptococcus iniae TaxID=1346 RepID=A0A1J0N1M3_STRIN|nr:Rid family detoxifying hydrolase [Streptococcus iniae]AGM99787.1 endoribonuclease L-PSP [Streptococcus iniae SF1]AHY16688.1 endoribonuclease L-PSP [Streptococcus iniae]AHY18553.1 endoribonuclease L-PSP [Streptococcus iniae]AJG26816.1 endoribonuclease L-PSP [Streptococcus iniae]APD32712.1 reactive intermediate/imine deaminase [Streptococcus iniae]
MIQRLTSDKTPAAVGSYSAASKVGNLIFTSGQLPINAETGKIDQPDSIEWQVNQSLTNIKHILEDNGSSMQAVVKTTVYLADIADFAAFNAVYQGFFTEGFPARTAFEVGKLPMGALVEIEAIAEV